MSIITGRTGVDEAGNVFAFQPAGPVLVGGAVSYGPTQTLNGGDNLPGGIWEVLEGRLEAAIGGATVRQVTIG